MKKISLGIYRQDPSADRKGKIVKYRVPVEEGMVVLDAVRHVQENTDPTLAVRWNCKAARCGSCAAEINGVPKLMCKTRIEDIGDDITVEPMRSFTLVKDLVTDISPAWAVARSLPHFHPRQRSVHPFRIEEMDVERSQEFRKCIECMLCMDVCHVKREHNTSYVGPRYIVKAASLDMHPMDSLDRSKFLDREGGIGYCNVTKCCQAICPAHIRITENAIIPEKERAADLFYDPLMMLLKRLRKVKD